MAPESSESQTAATAKNGRLASRASSSSLRTALTAQSFDDHATRPPTPRSTERNRQPKADLHDTEKGEKDELGDAGSLEEQTPKTLDVEAGIVPPNVQETPPVDRYKVTWDGADDPLNPKNWPVRKKWAAAVVVSSFTFISPVSSSMVAPALKAMSEELGIKTQMESAMVLSIFVLAYAVGPLFLGPLSEIYGRVKILQLTNLMYLVWNLACGFARSGPEILVFRFLSGFGGSAPLAIGGAVIGDCFSPDKRATAISMYSLAPLLGPAVGPIAGGYITQKTTWRWIFWATTILDAAIQLFGIFYLQGELLLQVRSHTDSKQETYAPVLLQRKAAQRRKETGDDAYYTEYDTQDRSITTILGHAFIRPFRMLFTQPIIQAIAGATVQCSACC
jgi:multidrug resistance protein